MKSYNSRRVYVGCASQAARVMAFITHLEHLRLLKMIEEQLICIRSHSIFAEYSITETGFNKLRYRKRMKAPLQSFMTFESPIVAAIVAGEEVEAKYSAKKMRPEIDDTMRQRIKRGIVDGKAMQCERCIV